MRNSMNVEFGDSDGNQSFDGCTAPVENGPPMLVANPEVWFPVGGNDYSGKGYINSGLFDKLMTGVDTFYLKFKTPGTFDYLCILHPGMTGKVVVTE
jgi:hypothetical protein